MRTLDQTIYTSESQFEIIGYRHYVYKPGENLKCAPPPEFVINSPKYEYKSDCRIKRLRNIWYNTSFFVQMNDMMYLFRIILGMSFLEKIIYLRCD